MLLADFVNSLIQQLSDTLTREVQLHGNHIHTLLLAIQAVIQTDDLLFTRMKRLDYYLQIMPQRIRKQRFIRCLG